MIRRISGVALCAATVLFLSHTAAANATCRNFPGSYTASKHWLASAEKGDPLAQANVGDMYRRGDGVNKNFSKAGAWLKKSVAQGCEQGEFALSALLMDMELEKNPNAYLSKTTSEIMEESLKWKLKAASKGLPSAQYSMGRILEVGLFGVVKDPEKAFALYQQAADQGYGVARWQLGLMYRDGKTVDRNLVESYFLMSIGSAPSSEDADAERNTVRQQMTDSQIRIAESRLQAWRENEEFEVVKALAELDGPSALPEAQLALAWKYRKGKGTPKDNALALKWFMKAAEQGNADAQLGVGVLLWEAEGVAKDSRVAFDWFKKSAMQGNALAQGFLGMM